MKPIRIGQRGAAVEDIQRRLGLLGFTCAPDQIDGVFGEETACAVSSFQRKQGLEADGVVDPRTWSALVDSTFELGDRMLYLRLPHFHGADVTGLQHALNSLGFVTDEADGIFGSFTERAVAEFQSNSGISADGLVGPDTFRALFALQHIWGGKQGFAHSAAHGSSLRRLSVVASWRFIFDIDPSGESVAKRHQSALTRLARLANNLVEATSGDVSESEPAIVQVTLSVGEGKVIYHPDAHSFAQTLYSVYRFRNGVGQSVSIDVGYEILEQSGKTDEVPSLQHVATVLLDALCLAVTTEDMLDL